MATYASRLSVDTMSISSCSGSPTPNLSPASVNSFDTDATSASFISEPKAQSQLSSLLQYKAPLFSTTFASTRSTHLHFTAFPPIDLPKATFADLSFKAAISLLHSQLPSVLSPFSTPLTTLQPVCDISLPPFLIPYLHCDKWDFYTLSSPSQFPLPIGSLALSNSSTQSQHLALRLTPTGIERFLFPLPSVGSSNLIIYSCLHIEDRGTVHQDDSVPRETLYLVETTEVLCGWGLKWWLESALAKRTAAAHEGIRWRWDERVRADWDAIKARESEIAIEEKDLIVW